MTTTRSTRPRHDGPGRRCRRRLLGHRSSRRLAGRRRPPWKIWLALTSIGGTFDGAGQAICGRRRRGIGVDRELRAIAEAATDWAEMHNLLLHSLTLAASVMASLVPAAPGMTLKAVVNNIQVARWCLRRRRAAQEVQALRPSVAKLMLSLNRGLTTAFIGSGEARTWASGASVLGGSGEHDGARWSDGQGVRAAPQLRRFYRKIQKDIEANLGGNQWRKHTSNGRW